MKETITPVGARSLVRPHQAAHQTESGLIMDNTSNTAAAPIRGTIIAVGDTSTFKVGDLIMWRRYSVDDLKFITEKGEEVVSLVSDEDVLAKITNE